MDVNILLPAFFLFYGIWEASCCNKSCSTKGANSSCHMDKRRSADPRNVTKTEILKRIGTQFSIMLEDNPCVFETYDIDGDGLILREELESILGVKRETNDLFAFIHSIDVDGPITLAEFCAAIPHLVSECYGCCYDIY
ncbi:uncharacterized protein LOC132742729 [Ruditapes philippinarum]|uniref:uncharacterized protein LOC132742729 n=1 Tax=Ruditapes philippinarum TaxID=129788 RepID=UPI00295BB5C0|nr:uncharacterized protein LOC132742729 [Ruditapes philippinarum]